MSIATMIDLSNVRAKSLDSLLEFSNIYFENAASLLALNATTLNEATRDCAKVADALLSVTAPDDVIAIQCESTPSMIEKGRQYVTAIQEIGTRTQNKLIKLVQPQRN